MFSDISLLSKNKDAGVNRYSCGSRGTEILRIKSGPVAQFRQVKKKTRDTCDVRQISGLPQFYRNDSLVPRQGGGASSSQPHCRHRQAGIQEYTTPKAPIHTNLGYGRLRMRSKEGPVRAAGKNGNMTTRRIPEREASERSRWTIGHAALC